MHPQIRHFLTVFFITFADLGKQQYILLPLLIIGLLSLQIFISLLSNFSLDFIALTNVAYFRQIFLISFFRSIKI
jgi:hypothetical protein